ncbi:3598_t:CDS:1 [Scutellospora calospora]|uniref:3598_t:CDS:1 n=1 Tax=Scutellospora calospora TaxID=85575 RepID=A0ACA9LKG2_9GLOM|nr:3598_t:CDS:1 [Scutellospora calospora]
MSDPAWNEFIKHPSKTSKGHPGAECRYCEHKLSGQAQRLRAHLKSCQKYQNFLAQKNQNEFTILNSITQEKQNYPIDSYLLQPLSSTEKKTIDKKIARAFYANSIPHILIENKFFIQALKSLHPTYDPPSYWMISNNLLKEEYDTVQEQIQKIYLNEKFISISTDG